MFRRGAQSVFNMQKMHYSKLKNAYKETSERHPFVVQSIHSGILMGAGDFVAQTWLEKKSLAKVDYFRTSQFFCLGFIFVGPTIRTFYRFLDKTVKVTNPNIRTLQKVAIDQLLFVPVFLGSLVSIISYMHHQDVNLIKEKLKNEYTDIMMANYSVWPWMQLINFRFVPLGYQALFTQSVAVCWNTYLSWRTNREKEAKLRAPQLAEIAAA